MRGGNTERSFSINTDKVNTSSW